MNNYNKTLNFKINSFCINLPVTMTNNNLWYFSTGCKYIL